MNKDSKCGWCRNPVELCICGEWPQPETPYLGVLGLSNLRPRYVSDRWTPESRLTMQDPGDVEFNVDPGIAWWPVHRMTPWHSLGWISIELPRVGPQIRHLSHMGFSPSLVNQSFQSPNPGFHHKTYFFGRDILMGLVNQSKGPEPWLRIWPGSFRQSLRYTGNLDQRYVGFSIKQRQITNLSTK